jgi:hypothetical protein
MSDLNRRARPNLDEFMAAILGRPERERVGAFAAAVLEGHDSAGAAAFATAILGDPSAADAPEVNAGILRERNFNPDQPRDERGRWTSGDSQGIPTGDADTTEGIGQKDADTMLDRLKKCLQGKELFDKAEKAAKANGASGVTVKVEPPSNLPPNTESACDPQHGQIGIRDDVSKPSLLEDIIVELGNVTRAKQFADLDTKGIANMTRDDYIQAKEKLEFESVQDTARVWKAAAKDCGQDPSKCPTYGNPDDVLKMSFKAHFNRLSQEHKKRYGKQWDEANSGTR